MENTEHICEELKAAEMKTCIQTCKPKNIQDEDDKLVACHTMCDLSSTNLQEVCSSNEVDISCPLLTKKENHVCYDICQKHWGREDDLHKEFDNQCEEICDNSQPVIEKICDTVCEKYLPQDKCPQEICPIIMQGEKEACDAICHKFFPPQESTSVGFLALPTTV